jgi:hypothetical protein
VIFPKLGELLVIGSNRHRLAHFFNTGAPNQIASLKNRIQQRLMSHHRGVCFGCNSQLPIARIEPAVNGCRIARYQKMWRFGQAQYFL